MMTHLSFTKMHGLGNDFMVVDATENGFVPNAEQLKKWSHRNFGIGFDQFLLVEKSQRAEMDFKYRIFNGDGSEVEQCGNGARCFAQFVREQGLTDKNILHVETVKADIVLSVLANGEVTVDMGEPEFLPQNIPLNFGGQQEKYPLTLVGEVMEFSAVSMGNPHAVFVVDTADEYPVAEIGSVIENDEMFPNKVNVGFMEIESRHTIKLRVFERGAGETMACGSGACAAVVCGIQNNEIDSPVLVKVRGGVLQITWESAKSHVMMTGPAATIYYGIIDI